MLGNTAGKITGITLHYQKANTGCYGGRGGIGNTVGKILG